MQELSLNVLDIAQNSVKADATLIEITVAENTKDDTLSITVADNGCGMTEEVAKAASDPFYTTRTTRKVGLGLPFLKMAAEMTGGSFGIRSNPGRGTTVSVVFGLSHIDRMPLGDMRETMAALISCNPDIDFVYTHSKHALQGENGTVFRMDTRQFRQILGQVPLNEPEVVTFIREYFKENDV